MRIAKRDGSVSRPGVAAQDGHEQLVVPLALPTESMPQASLKSEAALLVDPLGSRIEVGSDNPDLTRVRRPFLGSESRVGRALP